MSDTHSWTPRPQTWEMPVTPLLTSKEYIDALKAERDSLREQLVHFGELHGAEHRAITAEMEQHKQIATDLRSDNDRLRAENDRLREALEKIRRMVAYSSEIGQIVHAALAKEETT